MRQRSSTAAPKTWKSERKRALLALSQHSTASSDGGMPTWSQPASLDMTASIDTSSSHYDGFAAEEDNCIDEKIPTFIESDDEGEDDDKDEDEKEEDGHVVQSKSSSHYYEEDNKPIEWQKPEWTKNPTLRTTVKGHTVKCGSDLQGPITHAKSMTLDTSGGDTSESSDKVFAWEKPCWTKPKLRPTRAGETVKKGKDLQAPITHVSKSNMDDVNFVANPLVLKPTTKGSCVRLGENLAGPITHVEKDELGNINWEANPHVILKQTDHGSSVRKGQDLQAPITHVQKEHMDDVNFEANPLILRSSTRGGGIRTGSDLARPITFINGK